MGIQQKEHRTAAAAERPNDLRCYVCESMDPLYGHSCVHAPATLKQFEKRCRDDARICMVSRQSLQLGRSAARQRLAQAPRWPRRHPLAPVEARVGHALRGAAHRVAYLPHCRRSGRAAGPQLGAIWRRLAAGPLGWRGGCGWCGGYQRSRLTLVTPLPCDSAHALSPPRQTKRFSYTTSTENTTSEPRLFSLERNCTSKCEPGCIIIGERTKLYACTECCEANLCNTGNGARGAVPRPSWARLLPCVYVPLLVPLLLH